MSTIVIFGMNRNFFGAQIVQIPYLQKLRSAHPDQKIILFSKNSLSKLFLDLKLVDEVILNKGYGFTYNYLRSHSIYATINFRDKSKLLEIIQVFTKATYKLGFKNLFTKLFFTHTYTNDIEVYRALNLLYLVKPLLGESFSQDLFLTSFKPQSSTLNISLFPGAGDAYKLWDIQNYLQVAQNLSNHYDQEVIIHLFIGNNEDHLTDPFIQDKSLKTVIHKNKPITEILSLLSQSILSIGNDTGPMHCAQLSNVNALVLFSHELEKGERVVKEWFYSRDKARYLLSEPYTSINTIKVTQVTKSSIELIDQEIVS